MHNEIGEGSFLADACIVGGHRIDGGEIELLANRVGSRTFIGNSALVPAGVNVGDDGLIGVLSTPPAEGNQTSHGTRWLGSPGFLLPSTEKASCFSNRQTFEPGLSRTFLRALVDLVRVLLPGVVSMAALIAFCTAVYQSYYSSSVVLTLLLTPVFALATAFVTLLMTVVVRRVFMPRFKPVVKPLWCSYVWFNEVVNAVYEAAAGPLLAPLLGTPYMAWFLRGLGSRIGRWVFLETSLMSEFDLITIGDRAVLNIGSTIQPHLFEDQGDEVRYDQYRQILLGRQHGRCSLRHAHGERRDTGIVVGADEGRSAAALEPVAWHTESALRNSRGGAGSATPQGGRHGIALTARLAFVSFVAAMAAGFVASGACWRG